MTSITTIKAAVRNNTNAGRDSYHGLTTEEIAAYNRALMFGDDDDAFPEQNEWSSAVD